MSRYYRARQVHLPEQQPTIKVLGLIFHSIVGSGRAAYGLFLNSSNLESTFILEKQGPPDQIMESDERADANGAGNSFWQGGRLCGYASVETADNGDPDNDPWTESQINEMVELGVWYHRTHGVPLRRIRWHGDAGFGFHVMHGLDHCVGGRCYKKGPSPWTGVRGKTCPGFVRQVQFDTVVLPRIIAAAGGGPTQEDPLMALSDTAAKELHANAAAANLRAAFIQREVGEAVKDRQPDGTNRPTLLLRVDRIDRLDRAILALVKQLDAESPHDHSELLAGIEAALDESKETIVATFEEALAAAVALESGADA